MVDASTFRRLRWYPFNVGSIIRIVVGDIGTFGARIVQDADLREQKAFADEFVDDIGQTIEMFGHDHEANPTSLVLVDVIRLDLLRDVPEQIRALGAVDPIEWLMCARYPNLPG